MLNHRLLIATALLAVLSHASAPRAHADATLALSWDSCTGPVDRVSSGPGTYSLYASVTGMTEAHKAYEVWLAIGDSQNLVPDAWRFDLAGCQWAALATVNHLPPLAEAAACPALQGNGPSLQIKLVDLWPPGYGLPPTMLRARLSNTYVTAIQNPDPTRRYFLARFVFDHSHSVAGPGTPGTSCGGFETPMFFRDVRGSYFTPGGVEVPFLGSGTVTTRFIGNGSTPVHPVTWGAIKNQYR